MSQKGPNPGEVWFVSFPLEENPNEYMDRPVIVLNVESGEALSVKVTKTPPRPNDEYDIPITRWPYASLQFSSTARVSKTIKIPIEMFRRRIGVLHHEDLTSIQSALMKYISSHK